MNRTPLLPRRTLDYLANGAPAGSRSEELLQAAIQYRDAGISQGEAERELGPRAEGDGLGESEIKRTIASAFRHAARQPISGGQPSKITKARFTWRPQRKNSITLPPIEAARKFLAGFECGEADVWEASPVRPPDDWTLDGACLVSMLYEADEKINVVTRFQTDADGKARPGDAGVTLARGEAIRQLRAGALQSEAGGWLRMNPVDGAGVADANVTAFRFALVESDDALPLDLQLPLLARLPLPIAAILSSGGRSVHAWVRVESPDAKHYRETVARMLALLARFGVDAKNKNPARLSRLPGVLRKIGATRDGRQKLLYVNPDPEQKAIL